MFIAIYHEIHDQDLFKEKVNLMAPPPASLRRHQFLTATDLIRAACLWEAPSVDALRDYIDPQLEPASTQTYIQVNEERAVGLPERQLA
ncbi:MAG: hypothetical protein M3N52_11295 [Actinomycetota bacterium]|nr:hypothetical protein [Actinomycetota bacterium]